MAARPTLFRSNSIEETYEEAQRILNVDAYWKKSTEREKYILSSDDEEEEAESKSKGKEEKKGKEPDAKNTPVKGKRKSKAADDDDDEKEEASGSNEDEDIEEEENEDDDDGAKTKTPRKKGKATPKKKSVTPRKSTPKRRGPKKDDSDKDEDFKPEKKKSTPRKAKYTPKKKTARKTPIKVSAAKNLSVASSWKKDACFASTKEKRAAAVSAARASMPIDDSVWKSSLAPHKISVLYLSEERTEEFDVCASTTLLAFFQMLESTFTVQVKKARIVVQSPADGSYIQFDGIDAVSDPATGSRVIGTIGVKPGDTIRLISMMYSFPMEGSNIAASKSINVAVFDLFWGYPSFKRDFLDGSCLWFNKSGDFLGVVNFAQQPNDCPVSHSGDIMNDASRQGHHTIKVDLRRVTADMHTFYFVLSAYNSSYVSAFRNPTVMLFDERDKSEELCPPYVKKFSSDAQSLILCALTRSVSMEGNWDVIALGKTCAGNVRNYQPIKDVIKSECYPIVTAGLEGPPPDMPPSSTSSSTSTSTTDPSSTTSTTSTTTSTSTTTTSSSTATPASSDQPMEVAPQQQQQQQQQQQPVLESTPPPTSSSSTTTTKESASSSAIEVEEKPVAKEKDTATTNPVPTESTKEQPATIITPVPESSS